ncbi:MAG: glyoxalase family protein, partial [Abditibacteriota bacterium]|nr:glyoxalase family protein [Abditibacteriota bacterium]
MPVPPKPTQELGWVHRFIPAQHAAATHAGANQGQSPLTLLLLHGTGGNEDSLLELGRTLLPAATLLSPRGQVSEGGMPRFFRRLAEGVFDIEDLKRRTHELADFVTAAVDAYRLDASRVVAVGYSNGANIAASTLLLRPQ